MLEGREEAQPLFANPDFVVVAKPPGMETVSEDGGPELLAATRTALDEPGLQAVHRLDRDTSGAQLFARDPAAADRLQSMFRHRQVEKTYLAVCLGSPRNRSGVVNRNLTPWSGGRRPVRVVKQGGLPAVTAYETLAPAATAAGGLRLGLLAFFPHQGRTHQIRVHAAALGCPILGDDQYGDRAANKAAKTLFGLKRQALHALRLAFDWRGARVEVACPPPEDMRLLLEQAFGAKDWRQWTISSP